MRARMAIAISGQQVEFREVILRDKPPSMIELSPKGTVPVLSLSSGQVIDESLDVIDWALNQNDPDNWLRSSQSEKTLELIHTNDNEFKHHLDRYKYDTRFKDAKREEHKYKARDLLVNLNDRLEEKKWLNGDNVSLSDISILPFIRQYRIADIKWFDEQLELPNINRWLDNFLNSKILNDVMKKYKIWETTDPKIFL